MTWNNPSAVAFRFPSDTVIPCEVNFNYLAQLEDRGSERAFGYITSPVNIPGDPVAAVQRQEALAKIATALNKGPTAMVIRAFNGLANVDETNELGLTRDTNGYSMEWTAPLWYIDGDGQTYHGDHKGKADKLPVVDVAFVAPNKSGHKADPPHLAEREKAKAKEEDEPKAAEPKEKPAKVTKSKK